MQGITTLQGHDVTVSMDEVLSGVRTLNSLNEIIYDAYLDIVEKADTSLLNNVKTFLAVLKEELDKNSLFYDVVHLIRVANRIESLYNEGVLNRDVTLFDFVECKGTILKKLKIVESEPVESKSEPMESKSEPVETKSEPMESKSEPMESKSEPVETKSEPVETKSEPVENLDNTIYNIFKALKSVGLKELRNKLVHLDDATKMEALKDLLDLSDILAL